MKKKISLSEYPHVLTVKEVAEILRMTPKTIYKLLKEIGQELRRYCLS